MATLGVELCDAALRAAICNKNDLNCVAVADAQGVVEWPGFAYFDGQRFVFGRAAEDQWFVHPRRVAHSFWHRLAHEPSTLGPIGKPASFSELSFHFLREFYQRLATASSAAERTILAVPGAYLKDATTEEEKIGLLLGMAGELKTPLAGIVDMALASLCDPRSSGFNPALPVIVLDVHLDGAELTLFRTEQQLARKDFIHLPQSGLAQLLKHLTATTGNRFLRHTAFDILEDGRIEQTFFRQTKDFLLSGATEHRFQINTATRAYEMLAKREQLTADAASFVTALVQGLQNFVRNSPHASEPCTIALADRAARIPGLEARVRSAGFNRILRLPEGAAACGAAHIGETRPGALADLAEVQVDVAVPLTAARTSTAAPWEARLQKLRLSGPRPAPTHVILDGIGHSLGANSRFTIGVGAGTADLVLPEGFNSADDCAIPLVREGGRLWMMDAAGTNEGGPNSRMAIDAGDRLTIRCGNASADVLFAHCTANGSRDRDYGAPRPAMSIASKRRETEVFSLAFLDCICCGFGAVILVFILTLSQKTSTDKVDLEMEQAKMQKAQRDVSMTKEELDRLARVLAAAQLELEAIDAKNTQDQLKLTDRERELLLMLQQTGALKDALATLLGEKKALPTVEVAPPIPIPNVGGGQQYLTGVKLHGDFVLFLVRSSGSMLDETIDAAAARLEDSDDKKREAPKWQRVVNSLIWMLASLDPETHFQIVFFADDVAPILPTRGDEWFTTKDQPAIKEIVNRLREVVPKGGANLEKAFSSVRSLPRLPDSIVLFTDGLPTRSDTLPMEGSVDEPTRIRFFEIATKQLPPRIPVSTILFPFLTGDPGAPGLYWELANATRGAMVSPSKTWPDI